MQRSLLTILFLAIATLGFSQEYKENFKSQFSDYLNSIVNMEFEKSMEYILHEFFEIVPKD